MKKIVMSVLTVILVLSFCSLQCNDMKEEKIDYCIYDIYQGGILVDDDCLECKKGSFTNESTYYLKTNTKCN